MTGRQHQTACAPPEPMESIHKILRERTETDQAYADYLYLADKNLVTLPRLIKAVGTSLSVAGTLLAWADSIFVLALAMAMVSIGVSLIGLSYKLKRKVLDARARNGQ